MKNIFQISDYYQLLTLHRTIMEAKFTENSNTPELAGSVILAEVSNLILDTLIQMEVERGLSDRTFQWEQWRKIDKSRREWDIAVLRAKEATVWQQWTAEEKKLYIVTLLSPFIVDAKQIIEFITEVENA